MTLTTQQIPSHTHQLTASGTQATFTNPANNVPAKAPILATQTYGTDNPPDTLNTGTIGPAGGNQPHENTQPFLCINFIISLFGVFPTQT